MFGAAGGGVAARIDRQPAAVITAHSAADSLLLLLLQLQQRFPGRMMESISDAAAVSLRARVARVAAYINIYVCVSECAYGPAHRCCSVSAVLPLLLLVS